MFGQQQEILLSGNWSKLNFHIKRKSNFCVQYLEIASERRLEFHKNESKRGKRFSPDWFGWRRMTSPGFRRPLVPASNHLGRGSEESLTEERARTATSSYSPQGATGWRQGEKHTRAHGLGKQQGPWELRGGSRPLSQTLRVYSLRKWPPRKPFAKAPALSASRGGSRGLLPSTPLRPPPPNHGCGSVGLFRFCLSRGTAPHSLPLPRPDRGTAPIG